METVFLVCAVLGSTIMIIQFILALIGLDDHHDGDLPDHDIDHDASWFFSMISFKSLVAALAFFGLAGLAANASGWGVYIAITAGVGAGVLAMIFVTWLMGLLHRMHSEGNVQTFNALGSTGTVYLSIPGNKEGIGKVTVSVQNRTMEYQAVTSGGELPNGAQVVITEIIDNDTVEVMPERTQGE